MSARAALFERIAAPRKKELVAAWSREAERFITPAVPDMPAAPPFAVSFIDPFADPATHRIHAAAEAFADLLLCSPAGKIDPERLGVVEEFVRLAALQEKPAEEALALFFRMKDSMRMLIAAACRESNGPQPGCAKRAEACAELEARFDAVITPIFGMYVRCRETLHRLRREEAERCNIGLLRLLRKYYPGDL